MTFTIHHRAIKTRKSTKSTTNKEAANDCGITDQKHPTPTNGRNYLNVSLFFLLL